ncbi:MAG: aldehyde dehydrogenase family protein [Bacteroidia bacterium]
MEYKIYCGGEFITTEKKMEVRNPYSGEVFAHTYQASEKVLNEAIQKAEKIKEELRRLPSWKKSEVLLQIASELKAKKDHLARIMTMESGKPIRYSLGEIDRSIQTFTIAAEECKRLPREYLALDWTATGENKEGLIKYFPIGLVAGIAPFNFPMNLAVHKLAPAIAASCPIILKPASATPLSTLELAKIINDTDLPKGSVSILPCDRKTGNMLVTDQRFKLLSFTGSPEVGWEMKKNAGKKKVVLELGGNAGVIVSASANLDLALKKGIVAGFAYSGQICIHAQRFFVHEDLYAEFLKRFVIAAKELKQGDPMEAATEISSMIDQDNANRVESWINEAIDSGAKLVCGGKKQGAYMEPTVLTNTSAKMKVNCEEIFGPVVCIEKIKDINEGIAKINDTRFGLQCGVFTNSIEEMDLCFEKLEVGGVILNDVPTLRLDHMPYGGVKDSGLGREGVKYTLMDMMEPKILVK